MEENKNANKNKIFLGLGVLVIVIMGFFVFKNVSLAPIVNNDIKTNTEKIKIDPNIPGQTLPFSNSPKDVAWEVFQKYLVFNKNKNIEGVKSVVYKIAPVCENPQTRIDCEARMGSAYAYGSALKKENFTNVWSDEKQTILATDFKIQEDESGVGRSRAIIFFIKDEAGNLRMLSFSPRKGAFTQKSEASREEYMDRIILYTEDKDNDGAVDYIEECIPADMKDTCAPTNPKLRDTDGDGWWDGVEDLMNQMK